MFLVSYDLYVGRTTRACLSLILYGSFRMYRVFVCSFVSFFVCLLLCLLAYLCVCVEHLNRRKTSIGVLVCRGAMNLIPSTAQRRRWFEIVISTWDAGLTYLHFHPLWHAAKPRTAPTTFPTSCTFAAI